MRILIDIQFYPSIALSVLFFLVTFLVLRKSRTNVNISFALGSFFFGLGTLLAGLGYFDSSLEYLWTYATICITLGPSGYFIAGKFIVDGDKSFRSLETYIVLLIETLSVIGIFLFYDKYSVNDSTKIWDFVLVIILIFCTYQFYKVYEIAPALHIKLQFLLFGLLISIISLSINLVVLFITNEGTLLRTSIPVLGEIMVVLSFTSIPEGFFQGKLNS